MCHYGRMKLSVEDSEGVKKLSGVLIPVYATALLALIAFVVTSGSRDAELVSLTTVPASTR